jgi:hypothetical protein
MAMSWSRPFDDPIPLADGRQLLTLKDAGDYITKLPKAEHSAPEWQTAIHRLIRAAEGRDFVMHARIGMLRALNHGKPAPAPEPRRKLVKTYQVIK